MSIELGQQWLEKLQQGFSLNLSRFIRYFKTRDAMAFETQ